MKNWTWATLYFLLGYGIATVVGFAFFMVHEVAMWVSMFTVMPVVFVFLVCSYLRKARIGLERSDRETWKLVLYWIGLSFTLDALTYVLVFPAALGAQPNWSFFVDQTPWIWMAYSVLVLVGHTGNWLYRRRFKT